MDYIGTKQITAWPEEKMLEGNNVSSAGYVVKYPDGYVSWSPKEIFEKAYLPMGEGNTNSITQKMVDDFVADYIVVKMGEKTTLVQATLKNDFVIIESSSCVDPGNYDQECGKKLCVEKIKSKIWELLGFLLQTAKNGIK